jgi:hypothetical protein
MGGADGNASVGESAAQIVLLSQGAPRVGQCGTGLNVERRTPNAERRTSNVERRTPNAERRTPNAERRTLNAER